MKRLTVESAGKVLYTANDVHKIVFIKTLLEYSNDYAQSLEEREFWYLDNDNTTVTNPATATNKGISTRHVLSRGAGSVKTLIPLNHYSFFEELESRLLPLLN